MKLLFSLLLLLVPTALMAQTSARGIALVTAIVVPAVSVELSSSEPNQSQQLSTRQSSNEISFLGTTRIQLEFEGERLKQKHNLSLKHGIKTTVQFPSQKKTQTIRISHLSS